MSTHNIGFYEDLTKKLSLNYHHISSNMHLISSAAYRTTLFLSKTSRGSLSVLSVSCFASN